MANETYLAGLNDGPAPADAQSIKEALRLLDSALADAQKVRDDSTGVLARAKALATGVNVDSIVGEVKGLESAVASMHRTADRLLSDPSTTHARAQSFVADAVAISDLSVLKDNASRNSLSKLATDVSRQTAADVKTEVKALSVSLWDAVPLWGKVGGGLILAAAVYAKVRDW